MKPMVRFLLIMTLATTLYGCPYDSPYHLDDEPLQHIDESLLGKWATVVLKPGDDKHVKKEPVKIIFEKRTGMEYNIAITGYIEELRPWQAIINDSIKGTAYLSAVAGKQFINALISGRVYIAELIKDDSTISLLPLAENFTSKLIKNSRELRTAVEFHYKVKLTPGYEPFFSLKKLRRVN